MFSFPFNFHSHAHTHHWTKFAYRASIGQINGLWHWRIHQSISFEFLNLFCEFLAAVARFGHLCSFGSICVCACVHVCTNKIHAIRKETEKIAATDGAGKINLIYFNFFFFFFRFTNTIARVVVIAFDQLIAGPFKFLVRRCDIYYVYLKRCVRR